MKKLFKEERKSKKEMITKDYKHFLSLFGTGREREIEREREREREQAAKKHNNLYTRIYVHAKGQIEHLQLVFVALRISKQIPQQS